MKLIHSLLANSCISTVMLVGLNTLSRAMRFLMTMKTEGWRKMMNPRSGCKISYVYITIYVAPVIVEHFSYALACCFDSPSLGRPRVIVWRAGGTA
jgi:hypothetical protein